MTAWFPGAVAPVRRGVYERQVRLAPYSYWDGRRWGMSSQSAENAWRNRCMPSAWQGARWRGLAAPAEGAAS